MRRSAQTRAGIDLSSGRAVLAHLLLAILCATRTAMRSRDRSRPAGWTPIPPHPSLADSPTVKFWSRAELGEDWRPPACTGWTGEGFSTLVTTAARFRHTSGMEDLLRQSGAISSLAGMRYWSTTHKSWQTLIPDAYAVTNAQGTHRRKDFTLEELKPGKVLYFQQVDNLSGKAIFRLHIVEATPTGWCSTWPTSR